MLCLLCLLHRLEALLDLHLVFQEFVPLLLLSKVAFNHLRQLLLAAAFLRLSDFCLVLVKHFGALGKLLLLLGVEEFLGLQVRFKFLHFVLDLFLSVGAYHFDRSQALARLV